MSKSTSMLPSLAGGSGVAAHALVDSDLMKVVDAVTLNADRDRKVTLAELKAFFNRGEQYEILHNPATTGQQVLATIPNWNGSANSMTMNYGILRKDSLGIYTLDMVMESPAGPSSWTNAGSVRVELVAGTGAGTAMWDAFLTKMLAEQTAGYGILFVTGQVPMADYPAPIVHAESAELPAASDLPISTYAIPNPATHKLTLGCTQGDGSATFWDDVVKPTKTTSFRFTISTRVPV